MTIEQRVAAFLNDNIGMDFCSACLAKALGFRRSKTGDATARLEGRGPFTRAYNLCSQCQRDRLVIRTKRN